MGHLVQCTALTGCPLLLGKITSGVGMHAVDTVSSQADRMIILRLLPFRDTLEWARVHADFCWIAFPEIRHPRPYSVTL